MIRSLISTWILSFFLTPFAVHGFTPSLQPTHRPSTVTPSWSQLSSSTEDSQETVSASLLGKTVYQRSFHRFSAGSPQEDLEIPNSMVIEERLRYQVLDPENEPDVVSPVGPRTLILRQGQVDDGKIGDVFATLHVTTNLNKEGDKPMPHAGKMEAWRSTFATALYLSANPKTFLHGQVLQLAACTGHDLGMSSLLACIGAAQHLNPPDGEAVEQDILTVPHSSHVFPDDLQLLSLTDGSDMIINLPLIASNLQAAGIPSDKVLVEEVEWSIRRQRGAGVHANKEYQTIVASDLSYTVPEAKAFAHTVAHALEASEPYYVDVGKQGESIPRFVHVVNDSRDSVSYLQNFLQDGYKMSVDNNMISVESIQFVIQTIDTVPVEEEEAALDPLPLEVLESKVVDYRVLTAQHHPDYTGGGSGEYFFPMETGEYDARGGSTYLEKDPSGAGGGGWLGH